MNEADYTAKTGKRYHVKLPDGVPESDAMKGVIIGPPDLTLDLPQRVAVELHNQLHARRIYTLKDALKHRDEVRNAIAATLRLDVERVFAAYQAAESGNNNG